MQVAIIVDSTADLLPDIKERVHVVPLTVHFGNREYIDGITISHREFYEKLVNSDTLPSTSQATPAAFEDAFSALEGRSAVVLTISGKLSGTYQSAMIAAGEYDNIYVVDTGSVAIGSGILAELALQLADKGLSAQEIAQTLEQEKQNICVLALVDTLEYLKRGGRISKSAAIAGGLLNIKPVLSVTDGEIQILGKARGSKQGNNFLVQQIEKVGGMDFSRPVLLGYTGLSDALLQSYIADSKQLWASGTQALRCTMIGSVIGTHTGPGTVGVAFFKQ